MMYGELQVSNSNFECYTEQSQWLHHKHQNQNSIG